MFISDIDEWNKLSVRFSERVDFEIGSPCFEWVASRCSSGYGTLTLKVLGRQKTMQAHRLAYLLYYGELPDDLSILHACDNRVCVNPAHLRPGTHSDNAIDRESKGRGVDNSGTNNGRALLDWDTVRLMRTDYDGGVRPIDIFKKFPMFKQRTIESVIYKTGWLEK